MKINQYDKQVWSIDKVSFLYCWCFFVVAVGGVGSLGNNTKSTGSHREKDLRFEGQSKEINWDASLVRTQCFWIFSYVRVMFQSSVCVSICYKFIRSYNVSTLRELEDRGILSTDSLKHDCWEYVKMYYIVTTAHEHKLVPGDNEIIIHGAIHMFEIITNKI